MIELCAYWAHYSMWFPQSFPDAQCVMVEPEEINLRCRRNNFKINNYSGEFIKSFVGSNAFQLDDFSTSRKMDRLDILHSDIQGYEVEMLRGGENFLSENRADYVFISMHSQSLHAEVADLLSGYGYRIEVSSDFDNQSTSLDGFILASSRNVAPVFAGFSPLGRLDIAAADPRQLVAYLDSAITFGEPRQ